MELIVAGEPITLLPERAVSWRGTLLVADLHWGKSASFRALGLPVPDELGTDLDRLEALVRATAPDRVVVLGDLVHARGGLTDAVIDEVAAFRRRVPVEMTLVLGNHDDRAGPLPAAWGIETVRDRVDGPFQFRHHPAPGEGYVWAGHVHPGVYVPLALGGVRLPCFHLGPRIGVLPAFGGFTGAARFRRRSEDVVVAVVPGGGSPADRLYRVPFPDRPRVGKHVG